MLHKVDNKWRITLASDKGNTIFEFDSYDNANDFYEGLKKAKMLSQYNKGGAYYRQKDVNIGFHGCYYAKQELEFIKK